MAADPLIGSTVGGCEILEVIGQGGMGVIYKARQMSLDRIVALKVLAPHLAENADFAERFRREARAIARINHPNILSVYDVGEENEVNFMIMELIEGQSLSHTLKERNEILPWKEGTDLIMQSARGLEAAQASGIVHRDIKPENLMLTKKGVIKVSDFGLAKDEGTVTMTEAVMGTPAYMSPEQCDGKQIDGRSDIYSLGGTFYRLITGHLPFEAETAMSMMFRHKHEALIHPHEVVKTIPQAISAVIFKMMAKKREHRYQSMTEVVDAIEQACAEKTPEPSAPPPPVANPPTAFMPEEKRGASRRMDAFAPFGSSRSLPAAGGSSTNIGHEGVSIPEDPYAAASKGDEYLARNDRITAMKFYRAALMSRTLDSSTRARLEQEVRKEITAHRQAADNFLKRGLLVEAGRELRITAELDPADEALKARVKELDTKLSQRRTLDNDIRTSIASSNFEKAIKLWDAAAPELHTDALAKQIENLRTVTVPSFKLAEQGDSYCKQGRLEEAINCFEDALKINTSCEPARIGINDARQKLSRVDHMLKEGYQYSLEQNYTKAIETWKPILSLRPGHPQTVKSLIDAYVAHAQHLRSHGDTEGALRAYKGAAEADPQNRNVRKTLEDFTVLYEKERALQDRASEALARNKVGAALACWNEIHKLNPANKKAVQQIAQLRKRRSGGALKTIALLILLTAIGAAGFQFYREKQTLAEANGLMEQKKFAEAGKVLKPAPIFMFKEESQRLQDEAEEKDSAQCAEALEAGGDFLAAADKWLKLAEKNRIRHGNNSVIADSYDRRALQCRVNQFNKLAKDSVKAAVKDPTPESESKWTAAIESLKNVSEVIGDRSKNDSDLNTERTAAEEKVGLIETIVQGLSYQRKKMFFQSRMQFERAKQFTKVMPDEGVDKYIQSVLSKLPTDTN